MPRLTRTVREKMLQQNEGKTITTYYSGKNFSQSTTYTISGGKLYIHVSGNTSWADSRFDDTREANEEEVHQFLYRYQSSLNYDEDA